MATFTRSNAWNAGGTFNNQDLHWYAIGVRAMMARALDDTASWWFFAAIHGEYVTPDNDPGQFPGWGHIPGVPNVPTTPLPTASAIDTYWDQCQHQSWFFPPWHRGYLVALEAQLREDIKAHGGPSTWALPYWDYFGAGQSVRHSARLCAAEDARWQQQRALRHRPLRAERQQHRVRADTRGAAAASRAAAELLRARDRCLPLEQRVYTGSDGNTPLPGFGGPLSGYWHGGNYPSGNLEQNPHNLTHVYIGGSRVRHRLRADGRPRPRGARPDLLSTPRERGPDVGRVERQLRRTRIPRIPTGSADLRPAANTSS